MTKCSVEWEEPALCLHGRNSGVKPDILTMAKGIGNGIPVGAFAMTEKVGTGIVKDREDHGANLWRQPAGMYGSQDGDRHF